MRKQRIFTLEYCKKEALKYNSKLEWFKNDIGSCRAAYRNNWVTECLQHIEGSHTSAKDWSWDKCMDDVSRFNNIKEWKQHSTDAYIVAATSGWYNSCIYNTIDRHYNKCKIDASKYKSLGEWHIKSPTLYKIACEKRLIDKCRVYMKGKKRNKLNNK